MSITSGELKEYKSSTITDGSSNGGRMSSNEVTSNTKNNVFPDVSSSERTSGVTRYRKIFHKVANDDDETLSSCRIHLENTTAGDDYVTLFEGTQTDVQSDISSPDEYAAGTLKTNVSAGGTSLVSVVENTSIVGYRTGDTIWVSDGSNSEYHENVTISKAGTDVTITLDTGDSLQNDYLSATPTYIACVIEVGDLEASTDSWNETGSGTYDESTYPLVLDNIGTVYDTWTLTFSDATNFSVSGTNEGSVGSGTTGSNFSPINGDFSKPYFTLRSSGWGGTWAAGDTITFTTNPAAHPVWRKQVVPAGSAAQASNSYDVRFTGETT